MNPLFQLSAVFLATLLASCAPTTDDQKPVRPNPVFAAGQAWTVTWEDGTKPATVQIPALSFVSEPYLFYSVSFTGKTDGVRAAFEFANADIRANMQITHARAPYGMEKQCIVLIDTAVQVGQVLNGVYAYQTGPGVYGEYLRTGKQGSLLGCTMTRIS